MLRLSIALAMGLSLGVGCGGEDNTHHLPPPGDGDADADSDGDTDGDADGDSDSECVADTDEDGYGILCPAGEDCDDYDPTIHDGCTGACREGVPGQDCPCFGTEDPFGCHSQQLYEDEHGRRRCRTGFMTCGENAVSETGFAWSECLDDQGLPVDR